MPYFYDWSTRASESEEEEKAEEEGELFNEREAIRKELRGMSTEDLLSFLQDRGADTSGDHEDLVERLAELFEPELDR